MTPERRRRDSDIHPTAIVDPSATLADTVRVGPYATIGAHVTLADRCR